MSKKLTFVAITFLAGTVLATAANALTITNSDTVKHDLKILVTGATGETKVKVAPGATATFDCTKGCKAHLGKDKGANDLMIAATAQTVTIAAGNKLSVQ
jgi:hypothetical protein